MPQGDRDKTREETNRRAPDESDALFSTLLAGPGVTERGASRRGDHVLSSAELPRVPGHRLISKIGEGGMGVVYEAEQESTGARVAVKVLRPGALRDSLRVRLFQREVQTLALLHHPGIATILLAGQTPDGLPFFAMEHVSGLPLDELVFHEEANRGRGVLRARLRLFLQVVAAIGYAHQRGVIHRDLKPANILVAANEKGEPQVKVLDFGLARITDADLERVSIHTEIGMIQGTLSYMSPEQSRGSSQDVDLRTDVYALGVILYELLAGRLPYDIHGAPLHQAVRIINEVAPVPLRRVRAEWQSELEDAERGVRGRPPIKVSPDLETIVEKALEKEPERRYQSAAELGADIERLLASQPILARPATPIYRLTRWVQRNPALTLAALLAGILFVVLWQASVGLTLAVFIAGPTLFALQQHRGKELLREERDETARQRDLAQMHMREAKHAQARAEAEARRANFETETARQVVDFLTGLFELTDPTQGTGEEIRAAQVLDRGATRAVVQLADRPLVQARLLLSIARVFTSLGLPERALPLAEQAQATFKEELGEEHAELGTAAHTLATIHSNAGRWAEGERLFRQAIDLRRRVLAPRDHSLAESIASLGLMLQKQGKHEASLPLLEEALAMFDAEKTEDPPLHDRVHPEILVCLALLHKELGNLPVAEGFYRRALDLRRTAGESNYHLAESENGLGTILLATGKLDEAEAAFRRALELRQSVLGEEDHRVAETVNNLAATLAAAGRSEEAETLFRLSLTTKRKHLAPDDQRIATSLLNLGSLLLKNGRLAEAEETLREAVSTFAARLDPAHWKIAAARVTLGDCLAQQERYEEAAPLMIDGCADLQATFGPDHERTVKARERLARLPGLDGASPPGDAG